MPDIQWIVTKATSDVSIQALNGMKKMRFLILKRII